MEEPTAHMSMEFQVMGRMNIIPSMQGFFVHVTPSFPVEGTLVMNNSVRVTDQTTPFTKSAYKGSVPLLRLTASFSDDTTSFDPVVIILMIKRLLNSTASWMH